MADEQNQSIMTPVDIESEMKKSYLDYAMSVIIGRALARCARWLEARAPPDSFRHV